MAGALRIQTVSGRDADSATFLELHRYLAASFPRVQEMLKREVVNELSLVYEWTGSNPSLPPLLFLAHLDVVPVEPGTEAQWTHPPFGGEVGDGFVWGRGALDDKSCVTALLEAIESLVSRGFRPERTILLAFGHDEEVGGEQGAKAIVDLLTQRNVHPHMILDEGALIAEGLVPGVRAPVALIGIAEKGNASVKITARGGGGHSSMPPPHTSVGLLATAIHQLERNPMPAAIDGPTAEQLRFLAPEMSFGMRLTMTNSWLLGPLVRRTLTQRAPTNAVVRTTMAATMINGGIKANVLPNQATAIVNFRIKPGDSIAGVLNHVSRTIEHPRLTAEVVPGGSEPSAVSSADSPQFDALHRTIRSVFPDVVVAPMLVIGSTDSRHYQGLSSSIYRFQPFRAAPPDLERIHGLNERISVEMYLDAIRFYAALMSTFGAAK
jgi:carboxypeptidase PM20D1